jgi:hypothetical protein
MTKINKIRVFNAVASINREYNGAPSRTVLAVNKTLNGLLVKERKTRFYTDSFQLTGREAKLFQKVGILEIEK